MPDENQGGSQNPPEPKYVTAEEIGNIVNAAVTSHLKRSLGTAIAEAVRPLTEQLTALKQAPPPTPGDDDDGKKKGKQTPEMLAMAKQIEDLQKNLKERDDRVAAAEKRNREDRAFSVLRQSLEGKVRPELLDMVAKNLFHVEGRVDFDEQGTPLFKSMRAPYVGGEPEEVRLPMAAGIDDYLRSDAAKAFLPAPSGGSGSAPLPKRGNQTPSGTDFSKPANTDAEKIRRAAEVEARAKVALGLR